MNQLRDHMLHECSHGSNDILSAACAASREDALACVAEIGAQKPALAAAPHQRATN